MIEKDVGGTNTTDKFGHSVSLSYYGNRLAVGIPGATRTIDGTEYSGVGVVNIYELLDESWNLLGSEMYKYLSNLSKGLVNYINKNHPKVKKKLVKDILKHIFTNQSSDFH